MEIKNPKFCIDCKHFQPLTKDLWGGERRVDFCTKNPTFDLVSGKEQFRLASVERCLINEPAHCTQDANWFESKDIKDADLDDLSKIPFGK